MFTKIENSVLYTCDKYGNKGRQIARDITFAVYCETQKLFLVTSLNGSVDTRDEYGNHRRQVGKNAVEARFDGTDILIRTKEGKNERRDKYGNLIRNY
jgi:hypothetical protein